MRSQFQGIPTNWFPEITLCEQKMMKIHSVKKKGVHMCVCVRWNLHTLRWGWDARFYSDPCDWRHNEEFASERDSFSFHRGTQKKETAASPADQAAHDSVWPHNGGLNIRECTQNVQVTPHRSWNLMRNEVKILGEHYSLPLHAPVGSSEECIVGRCQLERNLHCRLQTSVHPGLVNKWFRFRRGLWAPGNDERLIRWSMRRRLYCLLLLLLVNKTRDSPSTSGLRDRTRVTCKVFPTACRKYETKLVPEWIRNGAHVRM